MQFSFFSLTLNLTILQLLVLQSWLTFQDESSVQVLVLLENNLLTGVKYTCNLLRLAFTVGTEQPISLHQAKVS